MDFLLGCEDVGIHEVKLQQEVGKLLYEKNSWLQKQVSLEEKMKVLQNDIESRAKKKGAVLEEKVNDFQIVINKLIEEETIVEDKIKIIEGIVKDYSLILKEISLREMIARVVEEGNKALQMQPGTNTIIEENQRLMESITGMELRIQQLESKDTSCGNLIERMTKVSESYAGSNQHAPAAELNHVRMPDGSSTQSHVSEIVTVPPLEEIEIDEDKSQGKDIDKEWVGVPGSSFRCPTHQGSIPVAFFRCQLCQWC